nr:MAG TPA: hypothetical protein [Bacteriophage sp.]
MTTLIKTLGIELVRQAKIKLQCYLTLYALVT